MAVVSNSSPLILFGRAGRLGLLHELFDEVLIPQAVFEEVFIEGGGRSGTAEIAAIPWIRLRPLASGTIVGRLTKNVGRGEAEAIALAVELGMEIPVLTDDRLGRKYAKEFGLQVVGSAGILVQAKERGAVSLVRPILDELRSLGLYLGDATSREVLAAVNELSNPDAEAR